MIKEYSQSIVRHIMTIVVGLNLVTEGETIDTALASFFDKLNSGEPRALLVAGLTLATLVWSAIEKINHDKKLKEKEGK